MVAHILQCVLVLLLLVAAATDLRGRVIANALNLAIALLAPAYWWATGMALWPDMAMQVALGAGVFAIFAAFFALGWMGGGDVKLLAALALWLPAFLVLKLIVLMSVIGGVLTIAYVAIHRLRKLGRPQIPYGVAISAAALCVIGEPYLNQFT